MNSESEQRLSLQELKQRNSRQTALPVQAPPPEARPTKADWERMMKYMDALWYHADRQTDMLESVSRQMSQLPTRTQLDDLLKTVRHLEQMTEQAGKRNEKYSSKWIDWLPNFSLLVALKWIMLVTLLGSVTLVGWYGAVAIRGLFL